MEQYDSEELLLPLCFSRIAHHTPSKAFYDHKRAEGKIHHQAVSVLVKRRIHVLLAMLRYGQL